MGSEYQENTKNTIFLLYLSAITSGGRYSDCSDILTNVSPLGRFPQALPGENLEPYFSSDI